MGLQQGPSLEASANGGAAIEEGAPPCPVWEVLTGTSTST